MGALPTCELDLVPGTLHPFLLHAASGPGMLTGTPGGLSPMLFPFEVSSGAGNSVLRILLWVLQATQVWPIFLPGSKKFLCCPAGVQISLVPFKSLPSTQHHEISPHSCSLVLFILQGITHSLSCCHQSIPGGSFCSTSGHN